MAKCPAHQDTNASLKIDRGEDGRWLLFCHAGCSTQAVVEAVGLAMADLMPDTKPTARRPRKAVAEYDYTDESGSLIFQAVRFDPKDFRQRQPNGTGGWKWNLIGVRLVLFNLPALQGRTSVIVVEGEKDALGLQKLGLTATTSPMGAGKWREDYTQQLQAAGVKKIVVLPDSDTPGRAHADAVARSCATAGLDVKVVPVPAKDVSDWIAAGGTKADLLALIKAAPRYLPKASATAVSQSVVTRRLILTPASAIPPRPTKWLWEERTPLAELTLLGGREGVGKTIFGYTFAADVTRGRLKGACFGTGRAVIVAATEDSWEQTIVPRLMAADADLTQVFRIDVITSDDVHASLSLPRDLAALKLHILETRAVLLLADPLLSRVDAALDTHKDSEVRQALEPLVALAHETQVSIIGLIHVNKGTSNDALTMLMGSRAFTAVARAVLFVMADPDDEGLRLIGQAKNNLGRSDLPTLAFRIQAALVAKTVEGPVWTGQLVWQDGEATRSIRDALDAVADHAGDRTATSEAADWLQDFLVSRGGECDSATAKKEGSRAGHSIDAVKRARKKLGIASDSRDFPRKTYWSMPVGATTQGGASTAPTAPTAPTGPRGRHRESSTTLSDPQLAQSAQSALSADAPQAPASEEMVDGDIF